MKIKTNHRMTKDEFSILKTTLRNMSDTYYQKKKTSNYYAEIPKYVGIKLTNACNLRCAHCYQWNETGYHRYMEKEIKESYISIETIRMILDETESEKSRIYLWGGEPLLHKDFIEILELIKRYDREVAICTNGILIDRYVEQLSVMEKMELLIGVEGIEQVHDSIRGEGNFKRTFASLDKILLRKKEGKFKGKISVHTMISNEMRNNLYEYLCFLENKGIDMTIICFPWFISNECKYSMDEYYEENCKFLPRYDKNMRHSWYSFNYNFNSGYIGELLEQFELIEKKTWSMVIRYQPDLSAAQMQDFFEGKSIKTKRKCLALSERIEINPDETVSACKFFDEFVMGSLKEQRMLQVWNSDAYREFRKLVNENLMPICTKCSVLHLHGMEDCNE